MRANQTMLVLALFLGILGWYVGSSFNAAWRFDLWRRGISGYEAREATIELQQTLPADFPGGLVARIVIFKDGKYIGYITKWAHFGRPGDYASVANSFEMATSTCNHELLKLLAAEAKLASIVMGLFAAGKILWHRRKPMHAVKEKSP